VRSSLPQPAPRLAVELGLLSSGSTEDQRAPWIQRRFHGVSVDEELAAADVQEGGGSVQKHPNADGSLDRRVVGVAGFGENAGGAELRVGRQTSGGSARPWWRSCCPQ
jgi:hypothetical protein